MQCNAIDLCKWWDSGLFLKTVEYFSMQSYTSELMICNKSYMAFIVISLLVTTESDSKSALAKAKEHLTRPHSKDSQSTRLTSAKCSVSQISSFQLLGRLLDGHEVAGVWEGILPFWGVESCRLHNYQGWSPHKYHGKEVTSFVKQFFACL